ncbi:hypothetical protein ASE75_04205 [Sphingomonas sp. Leaf17]|uniref:hypothetical protein n=1 Tax=Sphingomonas sp. Leaf17 TaxID=1735683 RepID=UPI0006F2FB95|nr:hypothetical protein [Sphingomonas sp. Leaf17]KQM65475.1 hypothetical protein ASE75_04205 [Sphingomonas sp. Leaf17]
MIVDRVMRQIGTGTCFTSVPPALADASADGCVGTAIGRVGARSGGGKGDDAILAGVGMRR